MSVSSRITVRVAGDAMRASVDVAPGDAELLATALAHAGVVFGVVPGACSRLAESSRDPTSCLQGVLVAVGDSAVLGSDGYFAPAFEPGIQPGHLRAVAEPA